MSKHEHHRRLNDYKQFALYRGDDYIATGTMAELVELTGRTRDYLIWLSTPSAIKRLEAVKKPKRQLYIVNLEKD